MTSHNVEKGKKKTSSDEDLIDIKGDESPMIEEEMIDENLSLSGMDDEDDDEFSTDGPESTSRDF